MHRRLELRLVAGLRTLLLCSHSDGCLDLCSTHMDCSLRFLCSTVCFGSAVVVIDF